MNIFKKRPTWKIIFLDEGRFRHETLMSAIKDLPIRVVMVSGMDKPYQIYETNVEAKKK